MGNKFDHLTADCSINFKIWQTTVCSLNNLLLELTESSEHRRALAFARSHEPTIAWFTIALAIGVFVGFWTMALFATKGIVSVWVALPVNTLLAYFAYTPAHEACHHNITARRHRFAWLNTFVGVISAAPLLHNFHFHQLSHLEHHAHTNDPVKDPDHGIAGSSGLVLIVKSFTLFLVHYKFGYKLNVQRPDSRQRLTFAIIQNLTWIAMAAWLAWKFDAIAALLTTVLAALLASGFLAFAFDWLPHHPHTSQEKWQHTRIITLTPSLQAVWDVLLLGQSYHLVHHLYPRVPFYRYKSVFTKLKPYFLENGANIAKWKTGA